MAGVMNAPEKVVFPGHSTGAWSLAVAAFAVGGPFGAVVGGMYFVLKKNPSVCIIVGRGTHAFMMLHFLWRGPHITLANIHTLSYQGKWRTREVDVELSFCVLGPFWREGFCKPWRWTFSLLLLHVSSLDLRRDTRLC